MFGEGCYFNGGKVATLTVAPPVDGNKEETTPEEQEEGEQEEAKQDEGKKGKKQEEKEA